MTTSVSGVSTKSSSVGESECLPNLCFGHRTIRRTRQIRRPPMFVGCNHLGLLRRLFFCRRYPDRGLIATTTGRSDERVSLRDAIRGAPHGPRRTGKGGDFRRRAPRGPRLSPVQTNQNKTIAPNGSNKHIGLPDMASSSQNGVWKNWKGCDHNRSRPGGPVFRADYRRLRSDIHRIGTIATPAATQSGEASPGRCAISPTIVRGNRSGTTDSPIGPIQSVDDVP